MRRVDIWSAARTDVLGTPYEALDLPLGEDFEGPVVATLIRYRAGAAGAGRDRGGGRAVLYLPGYNDYFFHRHVAEFFTARGVSFYALDIRKCGRACQSGQTRNLCHAIGDYFPEIDAAADIIGTADGNGRLLLSGHSTGGLIAALWLAAAAGSGAWSRVTGLFLNSPFLSTGVPPGVQAVLNPTLRLITARRPAAAFPRGMSGRYGQSLHVDYGGEWEFNKDWKSTAGTRLRLGWLAAVHDGQRRVRAGLGIQVPILVLCAARSSGGKASLEEMRRSDSVLDVGSMVRLSARLGDDVTAVPIDDACHDVLLSCAAARDRAFAVLDGWLTALPGMA